MGGAMSSVTISGDTSGSIILQAPSVAGSTTLTLPTTSGTVLTTANAFSAGTGPAFSAYQSSVQGTFTSGTIIKVLFQTEEWDTNNNFASSTFTPTVAGYYQLNSSVRVDGSPTRIILQIYKNGNGYKSGTDTPTASSAGVVSSIVYANGTTDYFDIYVYATSAGTPTLNQTGTASIYFNGAMIRSA
jgi:hypothetical protein